MHTIDVTVNIPTRRVLDLLCNALDSGCCNYWMDHVETILPEGFRANDLEWLEDKPWGAREDYFAPLVAGGSIVFTEDEDSREGRGTDEPGAPLRKLVLDRAAIDRGLRLMANDERKHFGDFMSGNDDADTADVFLQWCLLGDIIYG